MRSILAATWLCFHLLGAASGDQQTGLLSWVKAWSIPIQDFRYDEQTSRKTLEARGVRLTDIEIPVLGATPPDADDPCSTVDLKGIAVTVQIEEMEISDSGRLLESEGGHQVFERRRLGFWDIVTGVQKLWGQMSNGVSDIFHGEWDKVKAGWANSIAILAGIDEFTVHDPKVTVEVNVGARFCLPLKNTQKIEISGCQSDIKVKTWSIEDAPTLVRKGLDAFDKQAKEFFESQFRDVVCGRDGGGLGPVEDAVEVIFARVEDQARSAKEQLTHTNEEHEKIRSSLNFYGWPESNVYSWLLTFDQKRELNGISFNSLLKPFFDKRVTTDPPGLCVFGSGSRCASMFADSVFHFGDTTLSLSNLSLHAHELDVKEFVAPKDIKNDPDLLGARLKTGAIRLTVAGAFEIESTLYGSNAHILNSFSISFGVSEFYTDLSLQLEVHDDCYRDLPNVLKLMPACIDKCMQPHGRFGVPELNVSINMDNLSVSLIASGKDQKEMKVVNSIQQFVNTLLVETVNSNNDLLNKFLKGILEPMVADYVNAGADEVGGVRGLFPYSSQTCPDPSTVGDHFSDLSILGIVLTALALPASLVVAAFHGRTGNQRSQGVSRLAFHPVVKPGHHVFVILASLGALTLYWCSNVADAGRMTVYLLQEGKEPTPAFSLNSFSTLESIRELWHADMKLLAILIASFSVAFPYLKLMLIFVVLWVPLSSRRRGYLINFLEQVGKLALLDAFVLLSLISLTSLEVNLIGHISAAVYLEPLLGFMYFLAATFACLLVGHLVLMLHASAEADDAADVDPDANSYINISRNERLGLTLYVFAMILCTVLAVVGAIRPLCTIEIDGLLGWILNFLKAKSEEAVEYQGDATAPSHWYEGLSTSLTAKQGNELTFSLVGLGLELATKNAGGATASFTVCQVVFFLFSMALPLCSVIANTVLAIRLLCSKLMHTTKQKITVLLGVSETLFVWAALDVCMLSQFVTVSQLDNANFLEGGPMVHSWIETILSQVLDPPIPGNVNEIMKFTPQFRDGSAILAASVVGMVSSSACFLYFAHKKTTELTLGNDIETNTPLNANGGD